MADCAIKKGGWSPDNYWTKPRNECKEKDKRCEQECCFYACKRKADKSNNSFEQCNKHHAIYDGTRCAAYFFCNLFLMLEWDVPYERASQSVSCNKHVIDPHKQDKDIKRKRWK